MGVMVELVSGGQVYYIRAEPPPPHLQDAKRLLLDASLMNVRNVQELYDKLPHAVPRDQVALFKPIEGVEEAYSYDVDFFAQFPEHPFTLKF